MTNAELLQSFVGEKILEISNKDIYDGKFTIHFEDGRKIELYAESRGGHGFLFVEVKND